MTNDESKTTGTRKAKVIAWLVVVALVALLGYVIYQQQNDPAVLEERSRMDQERQARIAEATERKQVAEAERRRKAQAERKAEWERQAKLQAEREKRARSWTHSQHEDEMSGEISYYASSKRVKPRRMMEFPYRDTVSSVHVVCKRGTSPRVHFWFSNAPNLTGDTTRSGYNDIQTRIRWDDDPVQNLRLTQTWGAKFLHVQYLGSRTVSTEKEQEFVRLVEGKTSLLLELSWYGSGRVHFLYDLTGAKDAIARIKDSCS